MCTLHSSIHHIENNIVIIAHKRGDLVRLPSFVDVLYFGFSHNTVHFHFVNLKIKAVLQMMKWTIPSSWVMDLVTGPL